MAKINNDMQSSQNCATPEDTKATEVATPQPETKAISRQLRTLKNNLIMFLDNNSNKDVDTKDEDEVNKLLGNMIVNNNKGQPITNNNSSKEDVDAKGEDKVNKLLRNIIVNNNKG